jgi:hypothetical protein
MEELLGLLGGKWVFEGLYEKGKLITASNTGTMVMLGSHHLTARWAPDFTLPLIFFAAAALALLAIVLAARRLGSTPSYSQDSQTRRGRPRAARRNACSKILGT